MTRQSRRSLGWLLRVIDVMRWLAPAARRREWRRQWRADLWHQWMWLDRRPDARTDRLSVAAHVFGAIRHALWLRLNERTLDMVSHDLRYGWRLMLRRPGFTAITVLMIGLGIGANVTIYSWVDAILLHPLPGVAGTDRLVVMNETRGGRNDLNTSWPNFVDLRAQRPAIVEDLIAYSMVALNIRTDRDPQRVFGMVVSGNYFDVMGVTPALGRAFLPEEDRTPDAAPVVVFSHSYWRDQFGEDPSVVGRTVMINGRAFTVIGIAPPGFRGNLAVIKADVWVPMTMQTTVMAGDRLAQRGSNWLQVMVKLKAGAALSRAQADFDVVKHNIESTHRNGPERGVRLTPLWRSPGTASSILLPVLSIVMGVVGIVLLIVCANVANLLLARAAGRQRETAVRLALGAGRSRLVQQLLTEHLLLGVAGGGAGAIIAFWSADLLRLFMPATGLPLATNAEVNGSVLVFATVLTLATTLIFGVVPAWQGSRANIVGALKEGSGSLSSSPRRTRVRHSLVVVQVALSLMLLVSAGLFLQTLHNAQTLDPGFSTRNGLLSAIDLLPAGYDTPRGTTFFRNLLERVRAIPGVQAATLAQTLPLNLGGGSSFTFAVDGYVPAPKEDLATSYNRVGSDYLRTMGITPVEGRDFTELDISGKPDVGIINETMARRYWGGRSAIGGRIRQGPRTIEVVGVVPDGKYSSFTESPRNYLFLPVQQSYQPNVELIVKTAGEPVASLPSIQQVVRALDPNLPLFDTRTIEEHLELSLFVQRMAASLLGAFGLLALALAMVGLYAVIAAGVSQRTPEIGMRMALGATRADIVGLVLKQGAWVTAGGLALGLSGSLAVTRLFKSQLVGVSATDAVSFAATSVLLLMVALAAIYLPARRAASIDPLRALRQE
jgi:macrolide transport system ATP-binding/permease protein